MILLIFLMLLNMIDKDYYKYFKGEFWNIKEEKA
jgi:hypothetical protein